MTKFSWYILQFTPKERISKKIDELENIIYKMLDKYELQSEIAIFMPNNFTVLNQTWYISPRTVKLIESILKKYGAIPCEEPKYDSVKMSVGNEIHAKDFFNN